MRRDRHFESGSSMAETAIAMGVLVLLIFGIVDFGRALYTYAYIGTIAREGARWAIVRGSQCSMIDHCNASADDIRNYVAGLAEGATSSGQMTVTPTWPTCTTGALKSKNDPGCAVAVNVRYQFNFLLPVMSSASIPMSTTSQMIISQ